jgi:thioredoxin 1
MPLTTTPPAASPIPPGSSVHWVICLCADWCGLCRDYGELFADMAVRYPGSRFAWLDIEDQAELVGDIEVETFPTLLVADAGGTRFLGPLRRMRRPCLACSTRWRSRASPPRPICPQPAPCCRPCGGAAALDQCQLT